MIFFSVLISHRTVHMRNCSVHLDIRFFLCKPVLVVKINCSHDRIEKKVVHSCEGLSTLCNWSFEDMTSKEGVAVNGLVSHTE